MSVLLVDDDRDLLDVLTFALRRAGFDVLQAHTAPAALDLLESERPDLLVLDVNLNGWSGFDILREVRRRSDLPVIMLTARDTEDDKVSGLELGADDYITKPFSYRELIARIRAHLRRYGQEEWAAPKPADALLRVGPLFLNVAEYVATLDGHPVDLTATEFRLLHYLMSNAGVVVPNHAILKQVWGYADAGGSDVVRVTVHRLRRKLGDDPGAPRLLHTVSGVGVMFKPQPS